jgi:hypothetical protein
MKHSEKIVQKRESYSNKEEEDFMDLKNRSKNISQKNSRYYDRVKEQLVSP